MKVLLPIIYHDLTHCIKRAFEQEGHTVRVFDWRAYGERNRHLVEPDIMKAAMDFQPDLAFCQFQAPGIISRLLPKALKEIGCFSVQWSGDVRSPLPQHYIDTAPHFDVTSFSNMTDVDTLRKLGHRSEFLQIGYDSLIYNNEGTGDRSGVVFVGNNYGGYKFAESEGRREMVQRMAKEFPEQFKAYGMSWEGIIPKRNIGGYLREPADADVHRTALVSLGFDHFHRPWFASDRLLRATACGAFVINQHYEGIETEHPYVIGTHSIDQMVNAVRYALDNPKQSETVGRLNAENTLKQHLWESRVRTIESWMQ
jgi:hypothetical protein